MFVGALGSSSIPMSLIYVHRRVVKKGQYLNLPRISPVNFSMTSLMNLWCTNSCGKERLQKTNFWLTNYFIIFIKVSDKFGR